MSTATSSPNPNYNSLLLIFLSMKPTKPSRRPILAHHSTQNNQQPPE